MFFKKTEVKEKEFFTDVEWVGSIENKRSTIEYCTSIWGNLVTWSKKHNVVARSWVSSSCIRDMWRIMVEAPRRTTGQKSSTQGLLW